MFHQAETGPIPVAVGSPGTSVVVEAGVVASGAPVVQAVALEVPAAFVGRSSVGSKHGTVTRNLGSSYYLQAASALGRKPGSGNVGI